MKTLRISTAGSVDDGKSTLIGRLLYDTKSLPQDKIENIQLLSDQKGLDEIDLSLITDGLSAEREQGITIDVAHIYFSTKKRKYIVADTPGHIEYTRNMITGASNADVFVILIDARKGIIEQTKRHLFIAALLEIKEIIFVLNKIDLVGYEEKNYLEILAQIKSLSESFNITNRNLSYFPISAKVGDNVAEKSTNTPWYTGPTLLEKLESIELKNDEVSNFRFDVQYVIRPHTDEYHDFRGYAGKVKHGTIKLGQELFVAATGLRAKVKSIRKYKEELLKAVKGDSVIIELDKDIDVSRGDLLVDNKIEGKKEFNSTICWLNKEDLNPSAKYTLQHGTSQSLVKFSSLDSVLDFENLEFTNEFEEIQVNSIGKVGIRSASPLFFDNYQTVKENGYFILIDEGTNNTVAVGFVSN